uniref:Uncharacterized protein n=1 Tax=Cajanus cajan TaxID=3821 RepID=A0A151U1I8_CAJCA|nr:hypothetical protein KK1_005799 [Cajanus cajan]
MSHHLKCKSKGGGGEAALEIDISKAYNHVHWNFLVAMMEKLGFDIQWIKWMTMCVKNVTYSIYINEQ